MRWSAAAMKSGTVADPDRRRTSPGCGQDRTKLRPLYLADFRLAFFDDRTAGFFAAFPVFFAAGFFPAFITGRAAGFLAVVFVFTVLLACFVGVLPAGAGLAADFCFLGAARGMSGIGIAAASLVSGI
jgi:hypothetical protein